MNVNDIKSEKSFADDLQRTNMLRLCVMNFLLLFFLCFLFLGRQGLMIYCVTDDDDDKD